MTLEINLINNHNYLIETRALARILKMPIIFERVHVQNGLKWSKMG